MNTPVQTAHGQVTLEEILKTFNKAKQYELNKSEWLKTDEGKEYNRNKSKEYYERHKDKVLEKRAKRYEQDKDTLLTRAKEYYALHSEEVLEKNKAKRKQKRELKAEKLNQTQA